MLVVLRIPPPVTVPVISTLAPNVASPVTSSPATLPKDPLVIVKPAMVAVVPDARILPATIEKSFPVISPESDVNPPAEK